MEGFNRNGSRTFIPNPEMIIPTITSNTGIGTIESFLEIKLKEEAIKTTTPTAPKTPNKWSASSMIKILVSK